MSAAVSSTSSNTADQRTLLSWWAPTTDSPVGSVNIRRPGDGLRLDSTGTRASNPAASSIRPETVISSQASVWLRYTCPRRRPPGRSSAGSSRSRRVRSSASGVVARLSVSACSTGRRPPSAPGPSTERNQAPPLSGGSSWTTSRLLRAAPTTGRAQRSRRLETSAPAATGASKPEPSSRVMNASATAAGVCVVGGGAGSSSLPAASRTMASTTALRISRVVLRASLGASSAMAPGMAAVSSLEVVGVDERGRPAHGQVQALAGGALRARGASGPRNREPRAARPRRPRGPAT